jgi:hypothetical protein
LAAAGDKRGHAATHAPAPTAPSSRLRSMESQAARAAC